MFDYSYEAERVHNNNRRAIALGQPGTLTLHQWVATLDYFYWKCAYCGGAFSVLEHIDCIELVGTIQSNCFPACMRCNSRKSNQPVWSIEWPEYATRAFRYWSELAQEPPSDDEVNEVIEAYYVARRHEKEARRSEPMTTFQIWMQEDLYEQLSIVAKRDQRSINKQMIWMLEQMLGGDKSQDRAQPPGDKTKGSAV